MTTKEDDMINEVRRERERLSSLRRQIREILAAKGTNRTKRAVRELQRQSAA